MSLKTYKDAVEKLQGRQNEDGLKLIYNWVKSGILPLKEFRKCVSSNIKHEKGTYYNEYGEEEY